MNKAFMVAALLVSNSVLAGTAKKMDDTANLTGLKSCFGNKLEVTQSE